MEKSLGRKIAYLRKKKGMTHEELGKRIGSNRSYVYNLENGEYDNPKLDKLLGISSALGVSLDYLTDNSRLPESLTSSDIILTNDDIELFRQFSRLRVDDQEKVRILIDVWANAWPGTDT